MKNYKKTMIMTLLLIMILSTISIGFAEVLNQEDIRTGFYLNDSNGDNKFIDIYSYLNNKKEYFGKITDTGLGNVIFVHQNGKGLDLKSILDNEDLRELKTDDFKESYKDIRTNEILKPKEELEKPNDFILEIDKSNYKVNDDIIVSGQISENELGIKDLDITMKIENHNEELITVAQIITDINGEFTYKFKLPEGTKLGEYKLTVKAGNPVNQSNILDFSIVD